MNGYRKCGVHTYNMEYYSGIKKNAKTQMNIDYSTVSERGRTQKAV